MSLLMSMLHYIYVLTFHLKKINHGSMQHPLPLKTTILEKPRDDGPSEEEEVYLREHVLDLFAYVRT